MTEELSLNLGLLGSSQPNFFTVQRVSPFPAASSPAATVLFPTTSFNL